MTVFLFYVILFVIKTFVMQEKVCSLCLLSKPLTDFYKESRVKDGRSRRCKKCHSKVTEKYRKKNPEIYRKASKKHWNALHDKKKHANWLKRYGLTHEKYVEMFEQQDGRCKICTKECSSGMNLSVDHCHKTGKIRGLLCKKCNSALGMLNDDIALFRSAIMYLKNFEE